jgi:hypothetical protein
MRLYERDRENPNRKDEPGAFKSAVIPLLAELEASANAHDTDRHMALYVQSPSLMFVFNGEVVRGWQALREMQLKWWDDGKATGTYRYLGDAVLEVLGEDTGFSNVVIAARKVVGDGSVIERTLAHSALWRKLPEGWRITFAHESSTK